MPIRIPNSLPAKLVLENENIFTIPFDRAEAQDIRPLNIILLNLMPTKIDTETQILRLIGNSPIQLEVDLLQTATYKSKNTPEDHLLKFYKFFDEIKDKRYDGLIVTGAPVENMEFTEVAYWNELCEIYDWADKNVFSSFNICWGAQAALYYYYGVPKYPTDKKVFGIFEHKNLEPTNPLVRGFDEIFLVPHSRHTETKARDLRRIPELTVLSVSDEAGLYLASTKNGRRVFVTGHSEYDRDTLAKEYFRDLNKGLPIEMPAHYFPGNDSEKKPLHSWRGHANLLYTNWINYIYQETPYDLTELDNL